jgi:NADH dehydrogenase
MVKRQTVLVVGGTGFVGRRVVELLKRAGHDVIIYHRGYRAVPTHADVIINCVGIIREDAESFKEAHVDLVRWLVRLAKKLKVKQFVQVSAIGVEHESTAYQRSKHTAEHIIRASGVPYAVIRPSMVFGRDDKSVNRFRALCRTGFFPLLANGRVQPVSVDTVAAVIVAAANLRIRNRVVEIAGPEVFTYRELADRIHPGVRVVKVPRWIVALVAGASPVVRSWPTKEMVRMLRQESVTKDKTVARLRIKNPRLR